MKKDIVDIMIRVIKEIKPVYMTDPEIISTEDFIERGFDSVELMMMILRIEEVFNISLTDEDITLDNLINFKKMYQLILAKNV